MDITDNLKSLFIKYKITDYLDGIGYTPIRESSDKIVYKCPIHGGSDTDKVPSFFVFLSGEYQTYYCFGCGSGANILNLRASLEKRPLAEILNELLSESGLDVGREGLIKHRLTDLLKCKVPTPHDIEKVYISINCAIREYLNSCGREDAEIDFCEKVIKQVDKVNQRFDYDAMTSLKDKIVEGLFQRSYRRKLKEQNIT